MEGTLRPHFLLALIVIALLLSFFIFLPFFAPLIMAVVFAVVLSPVLTFVRSRVRQNALSALITVFLALVCILLPLSLIGLVVGIEAEQLYTSLRAGGVQSVLDTFARLLDTYLPMLPFSPPDISAELDAYLSQGLEWLVRHFANAAVGAVGIVFNLFLFFIALFYFLRDGASFRRAILRLSPLSDTDDEIVLGRLELAVNSVVRGNLTIALIQGIIAAVGLTIFGVPNGILWGLATAFAALIPGVGTALIMIPAALYLLAIGSPLSALGLFLWGAIAVGLVDNFLGPHLVGSGAKLHPVLVLFSVLGGIALFGSIGIFLGPLSLSLLAALLSVYLEYASRTTYEPVGRER